MVTGGGAYIANGLYNADCITAMRTMPNECVDMVLTDPPYNINFVPQRTAGDLDAQYGKRYEIIIYANKGRAPFNPEMPRYDDIWKYSKVTGEKQIHQNQKPTDLLSRIIRQHTREGDLILDAFAGSCSTEVAAYRLQRDYIAFELSPTEYADGTQWLDAVRSQVSIFDLIKGGTI